MNRFRRIRAALAAASGLSKIWMVSMIDWLWSWSVNVDRGAELAIRIFGCRAGGEGIGGLDVAGLDQQLGVITDRGCVVVTGPEVGVDDVRMVAAADGRRSRQRRHDRQPQPSPSGESSSHRAPSCQVTETVTQAEVASSADPEVHRASGRIRGCGCRVINCISAASPNR